jgi:hypothetical protein
MPHKQLFLKRGKKECQRERINRKFAAACVCTGSANACPRLMGALYSSAAACVAATN